MPACLTPLSTVLDFVRYAISEMTRARVHFGHGYDNAWDEALVLVSHSIDCDLEHSPELLQARLLEHEKQSIIDAIVDRTQQRLPLAYITRQAYFAGLPFYVDKRVLIPRSPFAELVEQQFSPWLAEPPSRILELCTGSGCIALAIAHHLDTEAVVACDISEQALGVAESNAQRLGLTEAVDFVLSDLFTQIPKQPFDVIVANPPYVSQSECDSLPAEYWHEPRLGLLAEEDGIALAVRILKQAKDYLSENGLLFMEVGNSQDVLIQRFPTIPFCWLDFERGGEGVLMLSREQLVAHF